jgi:hypothetical protein
MTTLTISESGMVFGPFPSDTCFYIEKSNIYQSIQKGVKISEFLLLRKVETGSPVIWVVEAKQSTPNLESTESNSKDKFDSFIEEIRDKLLNGFLLGVAISLNRHNDAQSELPEAFRKLTIHDTDFRLVLVIKGHESSWLPPLQDALRQKLFAVAKVWGMASNAVAVINDDIAKKNGLIV